MSRDLGRIGFASQIVATACLSWLLGLAGAAHAQHPAAPRQIGVLLAGVSMNDSAQAGMLQAFRDGLSNAGYVEGRDVVIDWRIAAGDYAKVPQLATDLVRRKVDVIVTDITIGADAALRATPTIPIVMAAVADPVGSGLVANLAHPGANLTGLSLMLGELTVKRLELLKDTIPRARRVTILWNPATPYHAKAVQDVKAAAAAMSIDPQFVAVRWSTGMSSMWPRVKQARPQAIFVLDAPVFYRQRGELIALAAKDRIPIAFSDRTFVAEGALMSYGANYSDLFRRAAGYVDKILKGAKPGDLPIEQPTKFELAVNLKAAKALGITIPESVLLQADEVIR